MKKLIIASREIRKGSPKYSLQISVLNNFDVVGWSTIVIKC